MSKESDTKIELAKRPTKADDEIDITPMIDCVFLLLFFFMVTSKIDRQSPVEMPAVVNAVEVAPNKTVVVTAKFDSGGNAILFMGDGDSPDKAVSGEPKEQEERIRQYIEQEVSSRPDVTGIMIKADGKVAKRYIALLSRAAVSGGGGRRLYYGVEEE